MLINDSTTSGYYAMNAFSGSTQHNQITSPILPKLILQSNIIILTTIIITLYKKFKIQTIFQIKIPPSLKPNVISSQKIIHNNYLILSDSFSSLLGILNYVNLTDVPKQIQVKTYEARQKD